MSGRGTTNKHRVGSLWPTLALFGALAALAMLMEPPSQAVFIDTTSEGASSVTGDTLDPPTGVGSSRTGTTNNLSWTATVDTYADGYEIWRSENAGSGYSLHATVAGRTTVAYADDLCAGGACSPQYAETGGTLTANTTQATLAVPAGTEAGDFLLTIVGIAFQFPETNPAPSGWTLLIDEGGSADLLVYYRVADGTEPSTYTFTFGDARRTKAAMFRFTGVDTTTPIDATGTTNDNFPNPDAPSVTTTVDGALIVRILALWDQTATPPSGHTERYYSSTSSYTTLSMADETQTTAGATGTAVWSQSNYASNAVATVALRPGSPPTFYYRLRSTAASWRSADSGTASS
jgi:hypothetical protein